MNLIKLTDAVSGAVTSINADHYVAVVANNVIPGVSGIANAKAFVVLTTPITAVTGNAAASGLAVTQTVEQVTELVL